MGPRCATMDSGAVVSAKAQQYVAEIEAAAHKAGVRCECVRVTGDAPHEEILKIAANKGCDLIYMASHGKRGTSALLLGSETAKVLTYSSIPVLVYRERRRPPIASTFSFGLIRTEESQLPMQQGRVEIADPRRE